MAQFHVPQFIEVESKIFGPLTLKQFIYLAGGAAIIFLLHISLPLFLTVILAVPFGGFAVALAFLKINGRPFPKVLESAFYYYVRTRIYLWKKQKPKVPLKKEETPKGEPVYMPKLTESKLKDLAWSLDVKEKIK
ncbi:MAG: hypothetical protein A2909_02045 [Candidatus Tagabacteria bacterium RIFCSPLOWO2_01_FULL_39_11]|uniref:PrgI family protein n=1 Tax=Candidatus Tagabacteria bacterium RIFCSPLOWO2_01_FULL_39_11 TaxID=1802295 RepID=A0A1G2LPV6_9BACT|nr:MAG: hypothetical protein A2909_02045 [Candidatus Tagabacteria bacterium RIFCSPLOWO2_01_FULL_39_11]